MFDWKFSVCGRNGVDQFYCLKEKQKRHMTYFETYEL